MTRFGLRLVLPWPLMGLFVLALAIGWPRLAWAQPAVPAPVLVAVAANFSAPAKRIAQDFERQSGHKVTLALGSTGSLYAQISNGAPFTVFLSADDETPIKLEREGLGVAGTRWTYAIGRLVLWSQQRDRVDSQGQVLREPRLNKIALANPRLSPYGAAALETLRSLGLAEALAPKIVEGSHIGQVHQFVATGNADLGFVALSQVWSDGQIRGGSAWLVPAHLHTPIRQDAILLKAGASHAGAQAFLAYLRSEPAGAVVRAWGYER